MKQNIALITCLSKKYGLGHYERLKTLKKKLNLKNFFWIILGDRNSLSKWVDKIDKIYLINKIDNTNIFKILKKNNCVKTIMDLSNPSTLKKNKVLSLQNYLLDKKIKVISFDLPKQKLINSDISILPFYFKTKIYTAKKTKLFKGYDYIFFKKIKKYKYNKNVKKFQKILIVISGGDILNLSYKIFKLIKNLPYKFKVIIGDFKNARRIINSSNIFNKFSKNIYYEVAKSNFVICGEGTIKFIPIIMRKPVLMIHQFDTKSEMIRDIIKKKIIFSLGKLNNKNKYKIKKKIQSYLINQKIIDENVRNMKKYFNLSKMNVKQNLLLKNIKSL